MPPGSSPDWISTRPRLLWASAKSGRRRIGFAERGRHLAAARALAAEQEAQDVVRLGAAGLAASAWRSAAAADAQSGAGTDGRGRFSPASSCPSALSRSPARRYVMPEVDVDGGGRRQERDRALQARPGSREIARLAQGDAEERVGVAGGGIEERRSAAARPGPGRGSRCTRARRRGCSGPRRTRAGARPRARGG